MVLVFASLVDKVEQARRFLFLASLCSGILNRLRFSLLNSFSFGLSDSYLFCNETIVFSSFVFFNSLNFFVFQLLETEVRQAVYLR